MDSCVARENTSIARVCGCVGFFPCVFPCLSLSCCNSLQVQLIRRTGLVGDEQDRCST